MLPLLIIQTLKTMAKYTFYVVTRSSGDHYPVLIANNGKIPFNESVTRANKLELSIDNFFNAVRCYDVEVKRIKHADFKAKFPEFAKNAGKKKKP